MIRNESDVAAIIVEPVVGTNGSSFRRPNTSRACAKSAIVTACS